MTVTGGPGPPNTPGIQDQLGEVAVDPDTYDLIIPGTHNRYNPHDTDIKKVQRHVKKYQWEIVKANRYVSNNTGSSTALLYYQGYQEMIDRSLATSQSFETMVCLNKKADCSRQQSRCWRGPFVAGLYTP